MAITVMTISNAPSSLRGDLTKWMQEISIGVYIGNLNPRVREELWERVTQSVGKGQATCSYAMRNEIGYQFETHRTKQINVSFDGIPLVMMPREQTYIAKDLKKGFSNQAKYRQARKYSTRDKITTSLVPYIVLDIETNGLDPLRDDIIEIGAVKVKSNNSEEFHSLILIERQLPKNIVELTGITDQILADEGQDIVESLARFIKFIEELPIAGYNVSYDIKFINNKLRCSGMRPIRNKKIDLLGLVKKREDVFEVL